MTEDNEILKDAAVDEHADANELMKKIDKELTKVKYKSFGKVKERDSEKLDKDLVMLQREKVELIKKANSSDVEASVDKINEKMASIIQFNQRDAFEKEMADLRDVRRCKGKAASIFNLKEKIVGSKKTQAEAVVVRDPASGKDICDPTQIKKVSLDYCSDLLTNRSPKPEYEADIAMKKALHLLRMEEDEELSDLEFLSEDRFLETYQSLGKKKSNKYQFIMTGGNSLKLALYNLCKAVWKSERLPDQWCSSLLIQLYKGKGSKSDLSNQRFIHIKDEFPKFFGHIVVSAAKERIVAVMSKFQIGTKPGHMAQEHIFVLKSVISAHLHYGKPIILSMFDISKFFDRESLVDVMNELYKNGVQGKIYRLLYEMNKRTRISVQTPVGKSDEREIGETVGQGTLEGALVSAASLDNGVRDFFSSSVSEVSYGDMKLLPLLYQDDIGRLSLDIESTQSGNDLMEAMAESKLLDFNLEKSCFIVFGSKKERAEIQESLKSHPLFLCGREMVQEVEAKYLGDQFSGLGLSHSVSATIAQRRGLVTRAIFEIRAVIDDCRSHAVGGLSAGLDMWNMAVLPMLLYNSECWYEMAPKDIDELDKLQLMFLRTLLSVGSGCPTPTLYSETGAVLMQLRILHKKLIFLHHVATLPEGSLALDTLKVQEKFNFPGLVQECKQFLAEFRIADIGSYSKPQWKKMIKVRILEKNKKLLVERAKSQNYAKICIHELEKNDFKLKSYCKTLNLFDARLRFKIESKMTPTIRMNFQSDSEFSRLLWACPGCSIPGDVTHGARDTQTHVLICDSYAKFREGRNLNVDEDLVSFFKAVINDRM